MASRFIPSLRELGAAVLLTESVTPKITQLTDARIMIAGVIMAGLSLISFGAIQKYFILPYSIESGYQYLDEKNASQDLQILDLRNGYSAKEAATLLATWGPNGRLAYIGIEVLDMTFYMVGYRLFGVVFLNRCVSAVLHAFPSLGVKKYLPYAPRLPLYLSKIDLLENVLQCCAVVLFQNMSKTMDLASISENPNFIRLIKISSTVNMLKWLFLKLSLGCVLCLFTISRVGSISKKGQSLNKTD
jgi:hypothetical protein